LEACQCRAEIAENSLGTLSAQLNAAEMERDKLHERLGEATEQTESQREDMARKMNNLSTEIEHANEKNAVLGIELNDARIAAIQVQEQLDIKVSSLESDLLELKQESTAKALEVEGLQKELETAHQSLVDTACSRDHLEAQRESQQKEMTQQIGRLLTQVDCAEEKNTASSSERKDGTTDPLRMEEQLSPEIKSLKIDPLESNQNRATKASELEGLHEEVQSVQKSLGDAAMNRDEPVAGKKKVQPEIGSMQSNLAEINTATAAEGAAVGKLLDELKEFESLESNLAEITNATAAEGAAVGKLLEELKNDRSSLIDTTSVEDELTSLKSTVYADPTMAEKNCVSIATDNPCLESDNSNELDEAAIANQLSPHEGSVEEFSAAANNPIATGTASVTGSAGITNSREQEIQKKKKKKKKKRSKGKH